jgi:hypothetical protein
MYRPMIGCVAIRYSYVEFFVDILSTDLLTLLYHIIFYLEICSVRGKDDGRTGVTVDTSAVNLKWEERCTSHSMLSITVPTTGS